ncbi:39S ribosomal protein L23, mitochondrial isoform X2 [Neomonachus schauinslandi]|uniref:Large ribosomal subunit protein uL23m n=1 Tax=Neomonachus schauinslandi TaxID=29088 RepID=A0A8M1MRN9_NEOSC|nr:39S ribosomal protein L23, mitochondrial isoform X2 [Neomonachus schauinslandi]
MGTGGLGAHTGQNRAVSRGGPGALACGEPPPPLCFPLLLQWVNKWRSAGGDPGVPCSVSDADKSPRLRYPLYQLGGPQLRVFRTNFFIRLVRPGSVQPEDTVQFRIPMEMTRVDLRNYLERIYNVPVAAVRTRVQHGSNRKRDYRNVRMKKPDYKVAYVQLAHGQTFTFPDLFPEKNHGSPGDNDIQDRLLEGQRQRQSRDPRRGGVPDWFGL